MVPTSQEAISVIIPDHGIEQTNIGLPQNLIAAFKAALRGDVINKGDTGHAEHTTLFNGNVISRAKVVAVPLDAQDVSAAVKFCNAHALSISVKAGGFGTGGWAIAGDVVIDLVKMEKMFLDVPKEDASYVSLRERDTTEAMASMRHTHVATAADPTATPQDTMDVGDEDPSANQSNQAKGKRRRADSDSGAEARGQHLDPDIHTRLFANESYRRNKVVDNFLQGKIPSSDTIIPAIQMEDDVELQGEGSSSDRATVRRRLKSPPTGPIPGLSGTQFQASSALSDLGPTSAMSKSDSKDSNMTTSTDMTVGTTPPTSPEVSTPGKHQGSRALDQIQPGSGISNPASTSPAWRALSNQQRPPSQPSAVHPSNAFSPLSSQPPSQPQIQQPPPITIQSATHEPGALSSADPFDYLSSGDQGYGSRGLAEDSSYSYSSYSRPIYRQPPPPLPSGTGTFNVVHGASGSQVVRSPSGSPESQSQGGSGSRSGSSGNGGSRSPIGFVGDIATSLQAGVGAGLGPGNSLLDSENPWLPPRVSTTLTPEHPHVYITFGAGVLQKELDLFTAENPQLATDLNGQPRTVPYHIPLSAHPVGSSVMLLGGFGFLSRKWGLSVDALVEAEVVLADGRVVVVNKSENTELFWAIRGAGPAFGVVTRYVAKAYPVPVVFAGNLIYNFRPSTAPSLIKHVRDVIKGAPPELYANVLLTVGPNDQDTIIVVQLCFLGSKEHGQPFLDALMSWDGEKCLLNEVEEKSFLLQQNSVAQILRGKAGRQWYIRSALINSLPDDAIHETVLKFTSAPTGCTWLFELAGGAIANPSNPGYLSNTTAAETNSASGMASGSSNAATAANAASGFGDHGTCIPASQREASFTIAALHQWEIGVDDPRCVEVAEEWIGGTLAPVSTGAPYPSFLGRNESAERCKLAYGSNFNRLQALKQRYDPEHVLKHCFWPLDRHGDDVNIRVKEPDSPTM